MWPSSLFTETFTRRQITCRSAPDRCDWAIALAGSGLWHLLHLPLVLNPPPFLEFPTLSWPALPLLPRDKMYQGQDLDVATLPIELEALKHRRTPIGDAWCLLIEPCHYHYRTITSARQLLVLEHQLTWNRDIGPEGLCASVQPRRRLLRNRP